MTTTVQSVPQQRVAAIALDDISPLDIGAVAEIFGVDRELTAGWYEFTVCGERRGLVPTRGGLCLAVQQDLSELTVADTIIVPPVTRYMTERPSDTLLDALVAAHDRGCRIVSVCLGAFVLAAAGLLNGRRATTHWRYCTGLADAYPTVEVVPDVLYVDDGDVLTSGGVAAAVDLCLHIVRKDFGADIANRLARRLVVGPHRDGGQAQFVEHAVAARIDGPLGPTMSWALEHLDEELTGDELAQIANMSRRTFYRYFQDGTGTTPHRWLLAQRVVLACRLLETTDHTIDEVARRSGIGDTSALRRHFTSRVGLSPTAYRRAFGQRGAALERG
jgi:AraC family transcriptional regulator, transcriptional activator FtrA